MRTLTFVGLTDDGAGLVFSLPDGQKVVAPLDERLSAALRRDRARGGQMEIALQDMRPRDIQARIRAGASAEEVAEESGWELERVRRFEGPPLAERAWISERARATEIRRPEGDAPLDALVAERLETRGVDAQGLRWDAWKRDDGRWTVLLAYPAGQGDRVATWLYDPDGRTLVADDEEARWITEQPEQPAAEEGAAEAGDEGRPRLVSVPTGEGDDQRDTLTVDTTGAAAAPEPEPLEEAEPQPAAAASPEPGPAEEPAAEQAEPKPARPKPTPAERPRSGRGRRPSVPSWDEILFGSGKREDE